MAEEAFEEEEELVEEFVPWSRINKSKGGEELVDIVYHPESVHEENYTLTVGFYYIISLFVYHKHISYSLS